MSDFRYEIKLRYLLSDWKYWLKIRVGPYATNTHNWFLLKRFYFRFFLILVGWSGRWWWLKSSGSSDFGLASNVWQCDLNKWKNINTHPIDRSSLLTYFTLAWQSNFQIFLMWSQITFLLSIRRTGSQQIDFKVLSLWVWKYFRKF
jgi:hypothetical protein